MVASYGTINVKLGLMNAVLAFIKQKISLHNINNIMKKQVISHIKSALYNLV